MFLGNGKLTDEYRRIANPAERVKISEKKIRGLARTDPETGTQADGMIDAMINIFGKNKLEIAMKYDPNITDIDMVRQIASDNKPWIAWIAPNASTSTKKHSIIVDKVVGNDVYIRDPASRGC